MATVKLTTPIKAHGEETETLTLREPTTPDIRELGLPFLIYENGATEIRAQTVARYIAKLAQIPMSSVDQLSPPDFSSVMGTVLGFFGDAPGEQ